MISIEGYTENEKLEIGRRHLIPKVVKEHGLSGAPPDFQDAAILEVEPERVSVKAKTREKLGAVGRNEAIEVHCVILLEERSR